MIRPSVPGSGTRVNVTLVVEPVADVSRKHAGPSHDPVKRDTVLTGSLTELHSIHHGVPHMLPVHGEGKT